MFLWLRTFVQEQAGIGAPDYGFRIPALPGDFETP